MSKHLNVRKASAWVFGGAWPFGNKGSPVPLKTTVEYGKSDETPENSITREMNPNPNNRGLREAEHQTSEREIGDRLSAVHSHDLRRPLSARTVGGPWATWAVCRKGKETPSKAQRESFLGHLPYYCYKHGNLCVFVELRVVQERRPTSRPNHKYVEISACFTRWNSGD